MSKYDYDLIVLGAGSGGLVSAVGATNLGLRVALLDGGMIGGDCLNFGCVPSKALLKAAKVAKSARTAEKFGVHTGVVTIDFEKVKEHITGVQEQIREHETAGYFRKKGMDVFQEYGEFQDPHTIRTANRTISATLIVIATGSRALIPPIDGLKETGFVTNKEVFSLNKIPKRLLVIGGGPIGTEMAYAYRNLGAQVTLLDTGSRILGKDDPDMAKEIQRSLHKDGVHFIFKARAARAESLNGWKRLYYEKGGKLRHEDAEEILIATGRRPNLEKLNLAAAGVKHSQRGIEVNASQQTSTPHIYALGDVTGGLQFTHAASLEAATFIKHGVFHLPAKTNYHGFPWVTYTDPELASAGLNEMEAKKRGIHYTIATADFSDNDRAIAERNGVGKIKVLLEPSRFFGLRGGKILGVQIVGPNAGELLHEYVVAIKAGWKASNLRGVVHAYPTLAEINRRAILNQLSDSPLLPKVRWILGKLFGFAGVQNPGENPGHTSKEVKHASVN